MGDEALVRAIRSSNEWAKDWERDKLSLLCGLPIIWRLGFTNLTKLERKTKRPKLNDEREFPSLPDTARAPSPPVQQTEHVRFVERL